MNILGLYGAINWNANLNYHEVTQDFTHVHDSGATLLINGNHICSISEERLSRIKYEGNFPSKSIDYCLSVGNITPQDIDLICVPSMCINIFYKQVNDNILHQKLNEIFPNAKIKLVSHHLSHAASSIFSCGFNEGSFLTLDGAGTKVYDPYKSEEILTETNTIGYFNKSQNIFRLYPGPTNVNNFGSYYQRWSNVIYNKKLHIKSSVESTAHNRDSAQGKIMGLSAYGSWENHDWKDYRLSTDYDLPFIMFKDMYGNKNIFDDTYNFKSPEDMSAILQKNFESALLDYLKELKKETYLTDNVCFSGGCFLNVIANSLIKESNLFDNIHIPPYTNDSGLHFGAACYGAFQNKEKITLTNNLALTGKEYSNGDILKELKSHSLKYTEYKSFDDLCEVTASYLYKNKIIGWFQNRSEFGPRALGARSLLMNPTPIENKNIMNVRVKHREEWRPFAGIILDEDFFEYFNEDYTSDYMLYSFTLKENKIQELGAITHVDNTCRAQTVNENLNPQITTLLKKYKKISGIPILMNTSFNDNGEPIVESPKDAIKAFLNMDIDYLVIGDYIVSKDQNTKFDKKIFCYK
jgi:carbamoyltransferase